MAQKYYNTAQAAEKLGLSEDEVSRLREQRTLHAYRDGANWKFKADEVEQLAQQRAAGGKQAEQPSADETPQDEGDVLLSEVEIGGSEPGTSGTVIGMTHPGEPSEGSDLDLAAEKPKAGDQPAAEGSKFDELDFTLDSSLTIENGGQGAATPKDDADDSSVRLDDDDLVLGGSGSGSEISLGGDSGISLIDPSDSGLSLEEPLDLGMGEESLELGEDDMIALDDSSTEAAEPEQTEDDFTLTPLDEETDEDSESGSQVIALDQEGEEAATVAGGSGTSMAAMLDEDIGEEAAVGFEAVDAEGMPMGAAPGAYPQAGALPQAAALPEEPWPVWTLVLLALCALLLAFCGVFMADLMRNMWSWGGPYDVNSSMMDMILGLFEG